jgi:hypothetical protein
VTIAVPDLSSHSLTFPQPNKLSFSGETSTSDKKYACELELFGEIDAENVKKNLNGKDLSLVLRKKGALLSLRSWVVYTADHKECDMAQSSMKVGLQLSMGTLSI